MEQKSDNRIFRCGSRWIQNLPLRITLDLYRKAVAWLIRVYKQEWEGPALVSGPSAA